MTKFCTVLLTIALALTSSATFADEEPFIDFQVDTTNNWIDVFYNANDHAGLEFNAWDLIVTPTTGSLLDPDPANRSDDVSDGAAADTWGNTVFSSFGAGAASYIFTAYHPGQSFPPTPQDPLPSAGGTPDRLEWTMFDTNGGDGYIDTLVPYHMARIVFSEGGAGTIEAKFFENGSAPDVPTILQEAYSDGAVDPNQSNTPPSVTDLFPGESFDQHTVAALLNPANYQMKGTDTEDGDDANLGWALDSFTGPFEIDGVTAIAGAGNGNQALSSTGSFTWDSLGSTRGFYFAGVTATDSGGLTDSGILRVQVPEPSSLILAGLSLVGIFASRRRNS